MTCNNTVFCNPFFWACATGLLLGFAVSMLTRSRISVVKRSTISIFAVAVAIICATVGAFVAGADALLDIALVYAVAGSTVVFGLGFRFPRSVGIPVVVLLSFVIGLIVVGLQSWTRYEYDQPILEFTARNQSEDELLVAYRIGDETRTAIYEEPAIEVVLSVLKTVDLWFFAGNYVKLRFPDDDHDRATRMIDSILPGWTVGIATSEVIRPRELYVYRLSFSSDDSVVLELNVPGE